jgi:GntR family transcriptional regulator
MERENSLYKRIGKQILDDYSSLLGGEALPGERALAEKYSVNRSTIQYALRKLADHEHVYRIRGKGTFILKNNSKIMNISDAAVKGTQGIAALVRSYGIQIRNVVLVSGTITGNRFLESKLGLQEGEPVFALHRVRYGNNEPLAIEYTYVPKKHFPDIEHIDFRTVSLYDYMDSRGHIPEKYDKRLCLIRLFPKEARYLELPVDAPAFSFELTGVDREKQPVEYTESYVRCDKAEFSFTVRI